MSAQRHVRVINPTTTAEWDEETLQAYQKFADGDTKLSVSHLAGGTPSVEYRRDIALVSPFIVMAAIQAERDGCDGVIVDCMADPGVAAAREAVRIPVVGPAESSMRLAAVLGHRFSVLTVAQHLREMMRERARWYGLGSKLASVRSLDIPVLELDDDPDRTFVEEVRLAKLSVLEDEADVIVPGCTGLAGEAARIRAVLLEDGIDVAVIDPPAAAMRQMEDILAQRLSTSRVSYPLRDNQMIGFPGLAGRAGAFDPATPSDPSV
ncbi:MAG: aspartate/glutamate racemase family protein [Actinobacteria bacterium]|nr:aspartate/glutamate racemase family protein [Actinomycetota bacterium]